MILVFLAGVVFLLVENELQPRYRRWKMRRAMAQLILSTAKLSQSFDELGRVCATLTISMSAVAQAMDQRLAERYRQIACQQVSAPWPHPLPHSPWSAPTMKALGPPPDPIATGESDAATQSETGSNARTGH